MHAQINAAQAQALARLVNALRPSWDVPGIAAALHKARHRAPAHELAHAVIRLATRADLASPAVLAQDGPHWRATPAETAEPINFDRCPQPGHGSFPAWSCGACRADEIAATEAAPVKPAGDPETYARGSELVRAALRESR
ncbi:hypothetical protein UQW22_09965 [Isoptericola halotolerans]|uniref:hypothetical protein n=1 Tax=Isoptericola halotolerans TaxID=300560 RepID=UPI00388DE856